MCQWAAWLAGLCVVPLHHSLPESLLHYHIEDSQSRLLIVSENFREKVAGLQINEESIILIPERMEQSDTQDVKNLVSFRALMETADVFWN